MTSANIVLCKAGRLHLHLRKEGDERLADALVNINNSNGDVERRHDGSDGHGAGAGTERRRKPWQCERERGDIREVKTGRNEEVFSVESLDVRTHMNKNVRIGMQLCGHRIHILQFFTVNFSLPFFPPFFSFDCFSLMRKEYFCKEVFLEPNTLALKQLLKFVKLYVIMHVYTH